MADIDLSNPAHAGWMYFIYQNFSAAQAQQLLQPNAARQVPQVVGAPEAIQQQPQGNQGNEAQANQNVANADGQQQQNLQNQN